MFTFNFGLSYFIIGIKAVKDSNFILKTHLFEPKISFSAHFCNKAEGFFNKTGAREDPEGRIYRRLMRASSTRERVVRNNLM